MRRLSTLAFAVCVIVLSGLALSGTVTPSPAGAAEGDPGDFCSFSPDYPFGWSFNEACEGHDSCLDELPTAASLLDRLGCDDDFFDDLLGSVHLSVDAVCEESTICSLLARIYYRVVRYVTLLTSGAVEPPSFPSAG